MTKVEKLRDRVLGNYHKIATDEKGLSRIIDIIETVDALISTVDAAAFARGKAAGAEQTKQWIRNTQDFIAQGDEVSCTDVHYATCVDNTEQDFAEAQVDLYVVPASILAPKEASNGTD